MSTDGEKHMFFGIRKEDGAFTKLGDCIDYPEMDFETEDICSAECVRTSFEAEFELEPPKNYRKLKPFVEVFHPSLNWLIWWTNTYGCNNWRKMHGLPMLRRIRK